MLLWVLWQISYAFQQCKNVNNRLRFEKVTESLKVGTFLRHSVHVKFVYMPNETNFNQFMASIITKLDKFTSVTYLSTAAFDGL